MRGARVLLGPHAQQSVSAHPIPLATAGGDKAGQLRFLAAGVSPPEPHQLLLMPETLEAVLGPAKCLLWGQWGRTQTHFPEPDLGNKRLKY